MAFKARIASPTEDTAKSIVSINKSANSPSSLTLIMSFPLIPLVPAWDNSITEVPALNISKFGDNGVEGRSNKYTINHTTLSLSVSVNLFNNKALQVDDFLKERNGRAFRLSLNGVTDDGNLYACNEWSMQLIGKNTHSFSATFEQVRRFL